MLAATMATAKAPKAAPKGTRATPKAEGEGRPSFAEVGRAAARDAQRKTLLAELKRQGWNLRATAEALQMGDASTVIRALKTLALEEYEAAKARGDIAPGRHRDS